MLLNAPPSISQLAVVGTAPPAAVDIWASQGNPSAITDWGVIINNLIADGAKWLFCQGQDFPFTTPINADGTSQVTITGVSGIDWRNDFSGSNAPCRLRYCGPNAPSAIHAIDANGFKIEKIGIYYDNDRAPQAFAGDILNLGHSSLGGVSGGATVIECHVGSYSGAHNTARSSILLDGAVCPRIIRSAVGDSIYGILGTVTMGSFAVRIDDCWFYNCQQAFLSNIGNRWVIISPTFEVHTTPACINSFPSLASVVVHSDFAISGIWGGDQDSGNNNPFFVLPAGAYWDSAVFHGESFLECNAGPMLQMLGGGSLCMSGQICQVVNNGAVVDLGNVVGLGNWSNATSYNLGDIVIYDSGKTYKSLIAGNLNNQPNTSPAAWVFYAEPKTSAWIAGNPFETTASETVLNQAGHYNLFIRGNGAAGSGEVEFLRGKSYEGYAQTGARNNIPTIQANPALPQTPTPTITAVQIYGTDRSGHLRIDVASSGAGISPGTILATVTYGGAYLQSPGYPGGDVRTQKPRVIISPQVIDEIWGPSGAATVVGNTALAGVGIHTTATGFSISVANPSAIFGSSIVLAYDVRGL